MGKIPVQRHFTSKKIFRVQVTHHQRGVGKCRILAPFCITGRTRHGARALRTHLKVPAIINPGYAASTRAYGMYVQCGDCNRQALKTLLCFHPGFACNNQGGIEAGTAHVDGNEVRFVDQRAECCRPDDTACRTGQNQVGRLILGCVNGDCSAAGPGKQKRAIKLPAVEFIVQFFQVHPRQRFNVGIYDCGTGTFVFSVLPGQPVRQGDGKSGVCIGQRFGQGQFMGGIDIGMQQADRHGANPLLLQLFTQRSRFFPVKFDQHFPLVIHSFRDFKDTVARHQRLRFSVFQVVQRFPVGTSQQINIAESLCRDDGKFGAAAGQ